MLKAVLFDLDGTLTNSDRVHFQVFRDLFAERGISIDKARYKSSISGRQNADIMAEFFPQYSAEEGQAFSEFKEAQFRDRAQSQLTPLPGLLDLLSQLKRQNIRAGLVTNAPHENAYFMLDTLYLRDAFDPIVIADDLPRGKPDPLPYRTALEKLSMSPKQAVVFEDSLTGIQSAVGAGITTIGVTTTHTSAELIAQGAAVTVDDFTQPIIQQYLLAPEEG